MRTTLNLSDEMVKEAVLASGMKNKTELINTALKEYVRVLKRRKLMSLRRANIIKPDFDILEERVLENEEC